MPEYQLRPVDLPGEPENHRTFHPKIIPVQLARSRANLPPELSATIPCSPDTGPWIEHALEIHSRYG